MKGKSRNCQRGITISLCVGTGSRYRDGQGYTCMIGALELNYVFLGGHMKWGSRCFCVKMDGGLWNEEFLWWINFAIY